MRFAILAFAISLLGASGHSGRHQAFSQCAACRSDCRKDGDCVASCYRAKAADCRRAGYGPGPKTTCDCT